MSQGNIYKSAQSPKNIFRLSQDQKFYIQYHLPKGFALISQSSLNQKKRKPIIEKSILQTPTFKFATSKDETSLRPIRKVVSEQKKKKQTQRQRSSSLHEAGIEKTQQKSEQSYQNKEPSQSPKKQSLQSVVNIQNSTIQQTEDHYNQQQQIQKNSDKSRQEEYEPISRDAISTKNSLQAVNLKNVDILNSIFKQEFYILKNLKSHDSIEPFLCPVNEIRDSAPDYYKIIKHPIDLQTIQSKMRSQIYTDPIEFHLDIDKMLSNSRTYNRGNPCMIKLTNQIQKFYQKLATKNRPSQAETAMHNAQGSNGPSKQRRRSNKKEIVIHKKQMKEK